MIRFEYEFKFKIQKIGSILQQKMYFETELEWLYYQLWTKNTARSPIFSFQIADTVIMRSGMPHTWYFSSKEGYVLKKNAHNVRLQKIHKTFLKKNQKVDQNPSTVCYHYMPQKNIETGEERMSLQTDFISCKDLSIYLKSGLTESQPNAIQAFVPPKLHRNNTIRVKWNHILFEMDRVTNKFAIFDTKHTVETRSTTFEDEQYGMYTDKQRLPNSGYTYDKLSRAVWQIHNHAKANSDVKLQSGMFFFKFDLDDEPVLLYAMQLKTERPIMALNGSIPMTLKLKYGAQAVINHSKQSIRSIKAYSAQPSELSTNSQRSTVHEETKQKGEYEQFTFQKEESYSEDYKLEEQRIPSTSGSLLNVNEASENKPHDIETVNIEVQRRSNATTSEKREEKKSQLPNIKKGSSDRGLFKQKHHSQQPEGQKSENRISSEAAQGMLQVQTLDIQKQIAQAKKCLTKPHESEEKVALSAQPDSFITTATKNQTGRIVSEKTDSFITSKTKQRNSVNYAADGKPPFIGTRQVTTGRASNSGIQYEKESSSRSIATNIPRIDKLCMCAFCQIKLAKNDPIIHPPPTFGGKAPRPKSAKQSFKEENHSNYELTINQIIKLYDFYEKNPSGLLLLRSENEKQQRFYEDIYGQVAYRSQQQQMHSGDVQGRVPRPIAHAFDLTSIQKYEMLQNDPSFIYTTVKICDSCYESVKSLISQTETNQSLLKMQNSNKSGSKINSRSSSNRKPKTKAAADEYKKEADTSHEEVTDMMSVEVKVSNTGARLTPRELTPRSVSADREKSIEQPFISPHSTKAMNLQAVINADAQPSTSRAPVLPLDPIEIYAAHERTSQDTPVSQTVPSSNSQSPRSEDKKQSNMAMMFQKVEAGKEVLKKVDENEMKTFKIGNVVKKQRSEIQFESGSVARTTGRRQNQSQQEVLDYLTQQINTEMPVELTDRATNYKPSAVFKKKHRTNKRNLALAEARQRKEDAKSVRIAQNIIGFVKSHNLPHVDSVSDHKSLKSPRILLSNRDNSLKNFHANERKNLKKARNNLLDYSEGLEQKQQQDLLQQHRIYLQQSDQAQNAVQMASMLNSQSPKTTNLIIAQAQNNFFYNHGSMPISQSMFAQKPSTMRSHDFDGVGFRTDNSSMTGMSPAETMYQYNHPRDKHRLKSYGGNSSKEEQAFVQRPQTTGYQLNRQLHRNGQGMHSHGLLHVPQSATNNTAVRESNSLERFDNSINQPILYSKYDAARIYLNPIGKVNAPPGARTFATKQSSSVQHGGTAGKPPKAVRQDRSKDKMRRYQQPEFISNVQVAGKYQKQTKKDIQNQKSPLKSKKPKVQKQLPNSDMYFDDEPLDTAQQQQAQKNYSTNSNVMTPPMNIQVKPSGAQKQQEAEPLPSGGGLLNFNAMSMAEIDSIAANADNLIQIIQSIKDRGQQSNEQSKDQIPRPQSGNPSTATYKHEVPGKIQECPYTGNTASEAVASDGPQSMSEKQPITATELNQPVMKFEQSSAQNMFEFPPDREATPGTNTIEFHSKHQSDHKQFNERETGSFGAGQQAPQNQLVSKKQSTIQSNQESNYTSDQFNATDALKSSQGYTGDQFNEESVGLNQHSMPDLHESKNLTYSSIAMESGMGVSGQQSVNMNFTGKQRKGMLESNKRLGSALAEMQNAGKDITNEEKKDGNWW